jgi:HPt (histidine-containing phosphotransfer) domain-containing protein
VDLAVLDSLDEVMGSRAETEAMLAEFLEHAEGWVVAITKEVAPGDRSDGHRAAHTLASSAATLGAHPLGRAAREIERTLATGGTPDVASRARLSALLVEVRAAWELAEREPRRSTT